MSLNVAITQDDIHCMRLQVLNQLTDLEYAQLGMKILSQVLVITGDMDKQELGKELKVPWVTEYISEYQAVGDNFEDAAEHIEQVMVGHGIKRHNEDC